MGVQYDVFVGQPSYWGTRQLDAHRHLVREPYTQGDTWSGSSNTHGDTFLQTSTGKNLQRMMPKIPITRPRTIPTVPQTFPRSSSVGVVTGHGVPGEEQTIHLYLKGWVNT